MQCSFCGGLVVWNSALTFTECKSCRAINSQTNDHELEDEEDGDWEGRDDYMDGDWEDD